MNRILIAGLLLAISAAPAAAVTEDEYGTAVRETTHAVILPGYVRLMASTASLRNTLTALCNMSDAAALDRARTSFAATLEQWARLQFLSFGPIAEHQRAARIEYWPDKRNVVGRQLNDVLGKQDPAALEPERFATTSVGVQGLPALERLLYEDDALTAIAKDAPGAEYRCQLLAAIGDNLNHIATDIVAGWTGGYLQSIEQPDEEGEEFRSERYVAARILNDLLTSTIAIRDMKILAALGDSIAKAKGQQAEFWRSGQSLAVLKANLEGLRELFGTDGGLGNLLRKTEGGAKVADDFAAALEQAFQALDRIALPLKDAVKDEGQRKEVEALAAQLVVLRDLLAGPFAATLNLPIGFNALDGD